MNDFLDKRHVRFLLIVEYSNNTYKEISSWDFPGGPVVKTSPFNAGGAGSIPGLGTKGSHDSWPKKTNQKQKQYCNKFNLDFKNGPHQKSLKKKKKKFLPYPLLFTSIIL